MNLILNTLGFQIKYFQIQQMINLLLIIKHSQIILKMPKQGGKRKKTRTHKEVDPKDEQDHVPNSFIIKRGRIGPYLRELLMNLRQLFHPYTALKLEESKKNSIKDFVSMAGVLGVTHMVILTQTDSGNYIRLIKNPKGPTITMKIDEYSLMKDVIAYQQKYKRNTKVFATTLQTAPLLIMNGFQNREESDHYKIVSLMVQSMVPPIQVNKMNLSTCKRVILFNLLRDDETGEEYIEFRHYGVSARQRSINKPIKKLLNHKKVPNLAKFNDIADFIMHSRRHKDGAMTSDSEAEDLPDSKIVLPDDFQDKKKDTTVSIRLHELGPRMKLSLVKIQEGLCKGNVVMHKFMQKSPAEIKKQLDGMKNKRELKEKRKQLQEENIQKKQERKEELQKEQEDKEAQKQLRIQQREALNQKPDKVRKSGKRDDASRLASEVDESKDARGQQRVGKKRFNRAVAAEREETQKAKQQKEVSQANSFQSKIKAKEDKKGKQFSGSRDSLKKTMSGNKRQKR